MYKLPERRGGGGGGGGIRAMPERKHSFFQEVFPYSILYYITGLNLHQKRILTFDRETFIPKVKYVLALNWSCIFNTFDKKRLFLPEAKVQS